MLTPQLYGLGPELARRTILIYSLLPCLWGCIILSRVNTKYYPCNPAGLRGSIRRFGILGFLLLAALGFSQTMYFDQIDRRDGLASSSVSGILQDTYGFLWIGTQSGLHRYDGYRFELFEYEPFNVESLSGNVVQTLYMDDAHNRIWVGTYQGLNSIDLTTLKVTRYPSLPNNVIVSILRDSQDDIWVGTLGGLHRLPRGETDFVPAPPSRSPAADQGSPPEDPLATETIRDIFEDTQGNLWVGVVNAGLYRLDREAGQFVLAAGGATMGLAPERTLSSPHVMDIEELGDGSLVLGIWGAGLAFFDPGTVRVTREQSFLAGTGDEQKNNFVYKIMQTRDGRIFAGTWGGGLFVFDSQDSSVDHYVPNPGTPGALAHDIVYSLFQDAGGIIWIGTHGNGINKYNPRTKAFQEMVHSPGDPGSLGTGTVTSILRDSRGRLWIGTYNGGLNLQTREGGDFRRFATSAAQRADRIQNDIIRVIYEDDSQTVWVGTNLGLHRFNEESEQFDFFSPLEQGGNLPDQTILSILQGPDDLLWLGTYSSGLALWSPETGTVAQYRHNPSRENSLSHNLIYALEEHPQNSIWVATNSGLNLFEPERQRFTRFTYDGTREGLAGGSVRSLLVDRQGNTWAGTTEGGITIISPQGEVVRHITKEHGLPSNTVTSITQDVLGNIWAGTNRGIAQVSIRDGAVSLFSRQQGLSNDEFASGAFSDETRDGMLYFGTQSGLAKVDPRQISKPEEVPRVKLTNLYLYSQKVWPREDDREEKRLEVPFDRNYLRIEYSALDFTAPSQLRYRYMLQGFDRDWIEAGSRREVTYTNLPGGTYAFYVVDVRESTASLDELEPQLILEVEVNPALSWWAFVLYGAGLLLMGYGVTQIRVTRALNSQIEELTETRAKLEQANEQLNYISYHDSLTGVGNRRMYQDVIESEWKRCRRTGSNLSLIEVDLDYFKLYNDTLGHPKGDEILITVAKLLQEVTARPGDSVCRIGGEEFMLVLPNTHLDGALTVARRLQALLREQAIPHPKSNVGSYVTLSAGVGTMVPKDNDYQVLVEAVDSALYRAKEGGRNRICVGELAE